jgi:hypothetical protein
MDNQGNPQYLGVTTYYSDDSVGSQTSKSERTDFDFFCANTTSDDDIHAPYHCIDTTDPLRYFLESGEITPNEYDRWRITKEKVPTPTAAATTATNSTHQTTRLDFGAGYNSDTDTTDTTDTESDDDDDAPTAPAAPTTVYYSYGNGYARQRAGQPDSWNPTPDPTRDGRYTSLANDGEYKLTRFTQWSSSKPLERKSRKMIPKLSASFELKIEWERFVDSSSHSHAVQRRTLQDFWSEHALQIYEALQELKDAQARVHATPEYHHHTTPFETLENTFETIGRMSRCIAEDFNAESIVEYVEEFMKALYREIEFNALVEEYEYVEEFMKALYREIEFNTLVQEYDNRIGDAAAEAKKLRKAAEKSVMSRLTKSAEFDFIVECDDQSRLPWCCKDD